MKLDAGTLSGLLVLLLPALAAARGASQEVQADEQPGEGGSEMQITSTAFKEGGQIPKQYTCDGADVSPPLAWSGVPSGARSLMLICDDPDAPGKTWVHWVYYDIPATASSLPQNVGSERRPAAGGVQGSNDFRKIGYGGPCPPGGTHHYTFRLYALDVLLNLEPGATKQQVLSAAKGHVLAEAALMGTYRR